MRARERWQEPDCWVWRLVPSSRPARLGKAVDRARGSLLRLLVQVKERFGERFAALAEVADPHDSRGSPPPGALALRVVARVELGLLDRRVERSSSGQVFDDASVAVGAERLGIGGQPRVEQL